MTIKRLKACFLKELKHILHVAIVSENKGIYNQNPYIECRPLYCKPIYLCSLNVWLAFRPMVQFQIDYVLYAHTTNCYRIFGEYDIIMTTNTKYVDAPDWNMMVYRLTLPF